MNYLNLKTFFLSLLVSFYTTTCFATDSTPQEFTRVNPSNLTTNLSLPNDYYSFEFWVPQGAIGSNCYISGGYPSIDSSVHNDQNNNVVRGLRLTACASPSDPYEVLFSSTNKYFSVPKNGTYIMRMTLYIWGDTYAGTGTGSPSIYVWVSRSSGTSLVAINTSAFALPGVGQTRSFFFQSGSLALKAGDQVHVYIYTSSAGNYNQLWLQGGAVYLLGQ